MERDFLGLNTKEQSTVVKEEINADGFKEIGGSAIQWPLCNKVPGTPAVPHLMSFKVAQEDKAKKVVSDPLMQPGFMSISTLDSYNSSQKHLLPEIQKPFNHSSQSGAHFSLTAAYPMQLDGRMYPVSNHGTPVSAGHPFLKNCYLTPSQNPHILGGFTIAAPQPIRPTVGSVVGTTDTCTKPSASSTQLTIFYAGSVNVFDGITPEKAQAIMLLAGNGSPQPATQLEIPSAKPIKADVGPVNHHNPTPPRSRLSSPISAGAMSGSGSTSTEEIAAAKTSGVASTVGRMEPPKVVNATGSVTANNMIPSVPQARKASLARFLEKRKERVTNVAPYNVSVKSQEHVPPAPREINFSITSA